MPFQVPDQSRNAKQPFLPGHRALSCTAAEDLPRLLVSVSIWLFSAFPPVQADSGTSQQSKATVSQVHAVEAGQPMLQDEDLDLRPAFLR